MVLPFFFSLFHLFALFIPHFLIDHQAERGAELRASDPGLVLADVTRKVSRWWKDAPQHERDVSAKKGKSEEIFF